MSYASTHLQLKLVEILIGKSNPPAAAMSIAEHLGELLPKCDNVVLKDIGESLIKLSESGQIVLSRTPEGMKQEYTPNKPI